MTDKTFNYPLQSAGATAAYSGGRRKGQVEERAFAEQVRQYNEQLTQQQRQFNEIQAQNKQKVEQAQKDQLLRTQRAQETLDVAKEQLKLAQDKFKQTSDVELQLILSGKARVAEEGETAEFIRDEQGYTTQPRLMRGEEYIPPTQPEVQPAVEQPVVQPTVEPELSEADRWETSVQSWKQQQEKKEFKEKYGDTEIIEPPPKPAPVTPTRPTIPEEIKQTGRTGQYMRFTNRIKSLEREQKNLKIPEEPKKSDFKTRVGKYSDVRYKQAVRTYNAKLKKAESIRKELKNDRDKLDTLMSTASDKWEAKVEKELKAKKMTVSQKIGLAQKIVVSDSYDEKAYTDRQVKWAKELIAKHTGGAETQQASGAERIRVKEKSTGETGSIPASEFNPDLYERI